MKVKNLQVFYQQNKRIIYSIYMMIKSNFIKKLGRRFKVLINRTNGYYCIQIKI